MNMIGIATNPDWLAFEILAGAEQVRMQLCFNGRFDQWLPSLCAENEMHGILYERLAHT